MSRVLRDGGRTWSATNRPVVDAGNTSQDLDIPLISELASGELLIVNHRWFVNMTETKLAALRGKRLIRDNHPGLTDAYGFDSLYFIRSGDQGAAWAGRPDRCPLPYGSFIGKTGVLEMPDGVLLMPLYGPAPADRIGRAFINRSTDGGKTWGQPSTVAHDPEQRIDFHGPPLLLLATQWKTVNPHAYHWGRRPSAPAQKWADPLHLGLSPSSIRSARRGE